ncbi:MAG TPA: hypothetical protein DIW44_00625 [Anaerolineaceae bacterium]|nr:hypothetical protein [Anaerolineaceae bacterium]
MRSKSNSFNHERLKIFLKIKSKKRTPKKPGRTVRDTLNYLKAKSKKPRNLQNTKKRIFRKSSRKTVGQRPLCDEGNWKLVDGSLTVPYKS